MGSWRAFVPFFEGMLHGVRNSRSRCWLAATDCLLTPCAAGDLAMLVSARGLSRGICRGWAVATRLPGGHCAPIIFGAVWPPEIQKIGARIGGPAAADAHRSRAVRGGQGPAWCAWGDCQRADPRPGRPRYDTNVHMPPSPVKSKNWPPARATRLGGEWGRRMAEDGVKPVSGTKAEDGGGWGQAGIRY